MDLYLIRHGESHGNVAGPLAGTADPPLTPRGFRQAELAGRRLAFEPLDVFYCGVMRRGLETAVRIAEVAGMAPILLPPLFEVGGNVAAWTEEAVAREFPTVRRNGAWPPERRDAPETFDAACGRARRIVQWLRDRYEATDVRVGMVGHGTFNQLLVAVLLDLPPREETWFSSGNGSFHWIEVRPGVTKIRKLNDESHLPPEARS